MAVSLIDLWLPIVLSAAAVWIAAAVAWMAMPHHKGEFKKLPNEDAMIAAVKSQNLSPGIYGFPDCQDHSKMKDPEFIKKVTDGPVGVVHVWPPGMKMGGKMIGSFVFYVVVSVLVALLATITLHRGEDWHSVFHVTALAAIMSYCLASIPQGIWFNVPIRNMITTLIDGLVFGLITAAIFALMWPGQM